MRMGRRVKHRRAGLKLVLASWLGLASFSGCAPDEGAEDSRTPSRPAPQEDQGARELVQQLLTGEVTRYHYQFDLRTAQAVATLTWRVSTAGNCVSVPFALPGVSEVRWNDVVVSATPADGRLLACGPTSVAAGNTFTLTTKATVPLATMPGLDVGFSRRTSLANSEFSYLLGWLGECDRLGPCDDTPGRLAKYTVTVLHDAGTPVLCAGVRTVNASDTQTQCDLSQTPAPPYSALFVAADPAWRTSAAPFLHTAGVKLSFYEVPGGQLAASLDNPNDKASLGQFMRWLRLLLGPFPYGPELRVAGGPTAWQGFEHPANIMLNERLPQQRLGYTHPTLHVLMHEMVHQWAGNQTTPASTADYVWKEAIAEYLTYVFEDEERPAGEAAATRRVWDTSLGVPYYPRPLDNPTPPLSVLAPSVTGSGPMVLFLQLEPLIGRTALLDAIQIFLSHPAQRAQDVEQLRRDMEEASGVSLSAYFNAWVYGQGMPLGPMLSASFAPTGLGSATTVTVTQTPMIWAGYYYGGAVEVLVKGATQSRLVTAPFGVSPAGPTASVLVDLSEPVLDVVLDPEHRFLAFQDRYLQALTPPSPLGPVF